jgi:hypothetical protein
MPPGRPSVVRTIRRLPCDVYTFLRLSLWNVAARPTDDWTIQQFRRSSPARPATGSSSTIEMGSTPGRRPNDRVDGTAGAGEILIGQRPKQLTPEPLRLLSLRCDHEASAPIPSDQLEKGGFLK